MLRERAKENAEEVEMAYGALLGELARYFLRTLTELGTTENSDDGVWAGISGTSDDKGKQKEEEYEDEEILATVTVVEDFDPDSFIHGPRIKTDPTAYQPQPTESKSTKSPRDTLKKKSKSKKIRYETKDARKVERTKQRARRTEKAELAGGKASRKKFSSGASKKKGGSKR
jgi:ribosomal RNA-processing protein 17